MEPENSNELVKERILNEAEALFAQKGYRGVTVREIIKAAECNLSAVNYYFGNKKKLYFEVFRSRWVPRANRLHECFQNFLATQGSASPSSVVGHSSLVDSLSPSSCVESPPPASVIDPVFPSSPVGTTSSVFLSESSFSRLSDDSSTGDNFGSDQHCTNVQEMVDKKRQTLNEGAWRFIVFSSSFPGILDLIRSA